MPPPEPEVPDAKFDWNTDVPMVARPPSLKKPPPPVVAAAPVAVLDTTWSPEAVRVLPLLIQNPPPSTAVF